MRVLILKLATCLRGFSCLAKDAGALAFTSPLAVSGHVGR